MISKILNKVFFFSILLVGAGIAFSLSDKAGSENYIQMWEIKINTTNGGVAIAILGATIFVVVVVKVLDFLHKQEGSNMLHQNLLIADKDSGKGISGAQIKINFQEGQKTYISDPNGYVKIDYLFQNKSALKFVEMEAEADGYEYVNNYRLHLEADKSLQKIELRKIKQTNKGKSAPKVIQQKSQSENSEQEEKWTELLKDTSIGNLQQFIDKHGDELPYSESIELKMLLGKYKFQRSACHSENLKNDLLAYLQKSGYKK